MKGLQAGKLALIVGAHTDYGRKHIGKVVTLHKFVPRGTSERYDKILFNSEQDAWIVLGDIYMLSTQNIRYDGFSFYSVKHLIPLEDPDLFKEDLNLYVDNRVIKPCEIPLRITHQK